MDAIDIIFGNESHDYGEDAVDQATQISFSDMYNYIRSMLGAPLVPVELTDEQLSNILSEALAEYARWRNFDENIVYMNIPPSSIGEGYEIPSIIGSVKNIVDIIVAPRLPFGYLAADVDMANSLYLQYFFQRYGRPGHAGFLSDYYIALSTLKDTALITGTEFRWEIVNNKIFVYPKPIQALLKIGIIYKSPITMDDINNDMLIKRYCVARAKVLQGTIRSTFGGVVPAGTENITLGFAELIQQGQTELEKVREEMRQQAEPISMIIG